MEIRYNELDKFRGEDVIRITSLTDTARFSPEESLLESVIEMNDGKVYLLTVEDAERKKATEALFDLMSRVVIKQRIHPNAEDKYEIFEQCDIHNKEDQMIYRDALDAYDDYVNEYESEKRKRKVVGAAVGAGAAVAAAGAAGYGLYSHFGNQEQANEETLQNETQVGKPEIKGTSLEFYFENAPESEQLTFEKSFYPAYEKLNTQMASHTYTSEAGVFGRLGLTTAQARLLFLVSHNYSDEQIAEIMGGELFNQIPMVDNEGNPVLDENGQQVMEDSAVIINQAYEVFQQWFKDAPLTSDDIEAVTGFFDTEHDKEIIRKFITGHNAILEATTDKEREEAAKAQRALYDQIFASDITDSDTKVSDEATAFLSRTMYVADYELANAYNYTSTELVYKVGTEERVEVTTNLYGEQFDAWFRYGMPNFDSENYLKRVGKNPNQYYVNKSSATMSITDATCDYVFGKITSANEYIRDLQNADTDIEVSSSQQLAMIEQRLAAGEELTADDFNQIKNGMHVISKLDQIKERTYSIVDIEDLMRNKLMELDKYPIHTEVFAEKWANTVIAIKDQLSPVKSSGRSTGSGAPTNPVTFNQGTTEENWQNAQEELIKRGATPEQATQMLTQAEEEENERKGILGRDNAETAQKAQAEADKRTQENQAKYNEIWNYAYNWYSQHGTGNGTPSLEGSYLSNTTSIDKNDTAGKVTVRDAYIDGKEAGIAKYNQDLINKANSGDKKAEEEARDKDLITGGEEKVDSWLKDYIQDGSISTDGKGNTTAEDYIDKKNDENSNNNNQPTVTNPGIVMPPPVEDNTQNTTTPDQNYGYDNQLPEGFAPIVDDNVSVGGETQIWSEEDILNQIDAIMKQQDAANNYNATVSDNIIDQAITEVAQEVSSAPEVNEEPAVEEQENNTYGGEVQIDESLLEYISFDEDTTSYTR